MTARLRWRRIALVLALALVAALPALGRAEPRGMGPDGSWSVGQSVRWFSLLLRYDTGVAVELTGPSKALCTELSVQIHVGIGTVDQGGLMPMATFCGNMQPAQYQIEVIADQPIDSQQRFDVRVDALVKAKKIGGKKIPVTMTVIANSLTQPSVTETVSAKSGKLMSVTIPDVEPVVHPILPPLGAGVDAGGAQ